jgi:hypothetical protein
MELEETVNIRICNAVLEYKSMSENKKAYKEYFKNIKMTPRNKKLKKIMKRRLRWRLLKVTCSKFRKEF